MSLRITAPMICISHLPLFKPQFGLGFTNAIVELNVDGTNALKSTYKFGR
ncbi:MAG: hypothetical protein LC802_04595 [Acidobacteria bacterium]|nr:hypothetical protein [Acidobacteriota bacterium]